MFNCRCCSKKITNPLFSANLLRKKIEYFECTNCGYVQTEEPDWLDEAYTVNINELDTGILSRNSSNVSLTIATLTLMKNRKSSVVDCAGGYGLLVRLLRDIGVDAYWSDPYCDNLLARGFEYKNNIKANLVTAFECFEHYVKPYDEMAKLIDIAPNILLTTNIISDPAPKPSEWWYYGLEHGQHIGFYRLKTLQYLADRFGLYLISDGISRHFFSKRKHSYHTWRILNSISSRFPKLLNKGMKSKTWSDRSVMLEKR